MMRKDHRTALRECAQSRVDGLGSASLENGLFALANHENAAERAYGANVAILPGGGGHNSLRSVEFRIESVECGELRGSALHFCFHATAECSFTHDGALAVDTVPSALRSCAHKAALARSRENCSETLATPENASDRAYGANAAILTGGGGIIALPLIKI